MIHELASIFYTSNKGIEVERLVALFSLAEGNEVLLGENLHEGGDGRVGRLWLWVPFYNRMRAHRLCLIPQDVHDFHLGLGECVYFFLVLRHII